MSWIDTTKGFLYAVSYTNGQMKFGVSIRSPKSRISDHDRLMQMLDAERDRTFVSDETSFPYRIEGLIKKRFSHHRVRGEEWLSASEFGRVVSFINESLIPIDCQERVRLLGERKKASDAMISAANAAVNRYDNIPERAKMALAFSRAVESCAKVHGYSGYLLEPSEEVPSESKLSEYVARYAYAHTADDIANVIRMAATDHAEMEAHLSECIGFLNVHHGVADAVYEYESSRTSAIAT